LHPTIRLNRGNVRLSLSRFYGNSFPLNVKPDSDRYRYENEYDYHRDGTIAIYSEIFKIECEPVNLLITGLERKAEKRGREKGTGYFFGNIAVSQKA
jgi:hypothetical protein